LVTSKEIGIEVNAEKAVHVSRKNVGHNHSFKIVSKSFWRWIFGNDTNKSELHAWRNL